MQPETYDNLFINQGVNFVYSMLPGYRLNKIILKENPAKIVQRYASKPQTVFGSNVLENNLKV